MDEARELPADSAGASGVAFEWGLLTLFALLLALVTMRRELWSDEMQAWLIVRDSHSLAQVFHLLHYEGHPSLWYLLLYPLAHITGNPAVMQGLNYLFTVAEGWLILSSRRLHWAIRLLALFSFYGFYNYGQIARSYSLAFLLMTAATRCLLGEPKHRKWAIVFLALAMNTHILAIPVAGAIALWGFGFAQVERGQRWSAVLRTKEFRTALVALVLAVAIACLTVRPAPADLGVAIWSKQVHPFSYDLVMTTGRTWMAFLPATAANVPAKLRDAFFPDGHIAIVATVFSILLFIVVFAALRTRAARWFFVVGSVLEVVALAITIKDPILHYLGMIYAVFLLALLIDAYTAGEAVRFRLPGAFGRGVVLAIFAFQALTALYASFSSVRHPYSDAKDTSDWIRQQGLDRNPMVLDGYYPEAAFGYMQRPTVYLSGCRCVGSYAHWTNQYEYDRHVTADDLTAARAGSALPVVLLRADEKMDAAEMQALGLVEIHSSAAKVSHGNYTVYEQLR